jgi:hypothetical protein
LKELSLAFALALTSGLANSALATTATIEVEANRPGASINPSLWGVFFEDINFGADGDLYADPDDDRFRFLWSGQRELNADRVLGSWSCR